MSKMTTRLFSLFTAILILFGMFTGCTGKTVKTEPAAQNAQKNDDRKTPEPKAADTKASSSKITDKPITLKYWAELSSDKVAPVHKSLGETKLYKELEKRTGVHIEFLHPPAGQANEQFNLIVASNDYPDLIERDLNGYPGGPEKAIQDKLIIKLNDLIEKNAPNLKKALAVKPEYEKYAKTDSGTYFSFPFFKYDLVYAGPQVRQDWMEELGLKAPTTIEEWEAMLKTFRDKKGAQAPFTFRTPEIKGSNFFISAFGIPYGFYVEGGKVKYGPAQPAYKEFLTLFSRWYKEKLIDSDFAIQDSKTMDAKITGDKAGSYYGSQGGAMGRYLNLMATQNPKFKLAGVPYPVLKKGDKPQLGQYSYPLYPNVSISTSNKYPKESAMWLDYGYSKEGYMLYNFGIEGESYTMVNNYPTYTELITKNPNGLPMGQAMSTYMRSHYNGPFVQAREFIEQFRQYKVQNEAVIEWEKCDQSKLMPPVTPTPEESTKMATIMNEINTYVDEMFVKFVMGQESLDKFDQYIENVTKMGLEEALKIQQTALERFNKR